MRVLTWTSGVLRTNYRMVSISRPPDGATVTVVGGTTPKLHDGWMWDLTVPGNNDHDFYIDVATAAVLVHNDCAAPQKAVGRTMHRRG